MEKSLKFKIFGGVALFLALITLFSSCSMVDARERGVVTLFGAVTGRVMEPGLSLKVPFIERATIINTGVQQFELTEAAASKDLQAVSITVSVTYFLDTDKVVELIKTIGDNYFEKYVSPSTQESIKASTAEYTADQLITKREEVREKIKMKLKEK